MDAISNALSSLPTVPSRLEQFANHGLESATNVGSKSELEARNEEIDAAAKEFESVFLSLLLKEMRSTLDQEEGGLFGGESSDTFGGMFDKFMGQHLAEAQPLGIADAIRTYMHSALSAEVDVQTTEGDAQPAEADSPE